MIKGKVQPSEKYIYKQMLPYTNAAKFNSLQVKSSVNRRELVLKQMEPSQTMQVPVVKAKTRTKKLKGSKMKRTEIPKNHSATNTAHKKGIIVEEDELSQSDCALDFQTEDDKVMGWQDYQDENEQLKEQIRNQITIFEQYLKVAILQHKQKENELLSGQRHGLNRMNSMDDHMLREEHFQFDQDEVKQLQQSAKRRNKTQHRKPDASFVSKLPAANGTIREVSIRNKSQASERSSPQLRITQRSNRKAYGMKYRHMTMRDNRSQDSDRAENRSISPTIYGQHRGDNVSVAMMSKHSSRDSSMSNGTKKSFVSKKKQVYMQMGSRLSNHKMKALEHLSSLQTATKLIHVTTHTAHQDWVQKIEKLWTKLNQHRNSEVVRIEDELRLNKQRIGQLTRENLFELDVNSHDQRVLLKARVRRGKVNRKMKAGKEERALRLLQGRIRHELARKMDFDTWGFHNHIIEYRIKVRMTEDLIDCAQRVTIQADAKSKRELVLLQLLRDRTYDDLRHFVDTRERKPWRNWDKMSFYYKGYKPALEDRNLTLNQVNERLEINLQIIVQLQPKYEQLLKEIPPYNCMNAEMIQFCTKMLGNEGWLQLFQLKQLRKNQEAEQNQKQYVPPVDAIKRFEVDPYTLQIEQKSSADESDGADEFGRALSPAEQKPSAWVIRRPENMTQGGLKTGYEPMKAKLSIPVTSQDPLTQIKSSETILIQEIDSTETTRHEINASGSVDDKGQESISAEHEEGGPSEASRQEGASIDQYGLSQNNQNQNYILVQKNQTPAKAGQNSALVGSTAHKYEGDDVVQHLLDKATVQDAIDQEEDAAVAIKKSNWLQVLEREKQEKADRDAVERKARAARLAILFEEEDVLSQDDADLLDMGAAHQDVKSYMEKIDTHLQVEKRLLEAWQEKDANPEVKKTGLSQSVKTAK